jgi:putative sigma-54 modulation protein
MKILIRTVNLELDGRARGEVESMLRGGFGQLAHRILRVTVRIVDQNGPRGGEDISAFVDVRLRPRGRLFNLETDRDPLAAVRKAGHAAVTAVTRMSERSRDMSRRASAGVLSEALQGPGSAGQSLA